MKKLAFGLVLFAFTLFASAASFDTNLSYGSMGSDVTSLQEFLTAQHVYNGPISGNFFSLTLAGVKAFQKAESISPISGFVGPITRGTINALLAVEAPVSEENAATTTLPIDLSQATTSPVVPPQVIYVQVPAPLPPTVQTPTFGSVGQASSCVENPTLGQVATSTDYSEGIIFKATFSDNCPLDSSTQVTFGIQTGDGTVLQSNNAAINKIIGLPASFLTLNANQEYTLTTYNGSLFAGPFQLANYLNRVSSTTPLYAFITVDGVTNTAQVQ